MEIKNLITTLWLGLSLILVGGCNQGSNKEAVSQKQKTDVTIASDIAKITTNNSAYVSPANCPDDYFKSLEQKPLKIQVNDVITALEKNGINPKQLQMEQGKYLGQETVTLYFGKDGKNELRMGGRDDNINNLFAIQIWFHDKKTQNNLENILFMKSVIEAVDPSVDSSKILQQLSKGSLDQIKKTNTTSRVCEIVNDVYIEYIETPEQMNIGVTLGLFFAQK